MATISVTSNLDVLEKYQSLVKQSLDGESAYIRAKETIQDLVDSGAIDNAQKAEIISTIVSTIVNNINSSSMSTAMSWASSEKDIELKKLELAKQLDILDQDNLLKQAQIEQISNAIRLDKVESKRIYGTAVFDANNNVISLDNTGKVIKDIELTTSQIVKSDSENTLIIQKVAESHAAVHKIVADTYVNYGNYTYTGLSASGIGTVSANHGSFKTLSDTQQGIAIEQAKGYTYNAWANALTGSASMLGTAIASELVDFTPGSTGSDLLITVLQTANNLKAASTTVYDAVPVL
jgi:hypothetical protein